MKKKLLSTIFVMLVCIAFGAFGASAATLKSGSTGNDVKKLQMNLSGLAYTTYADGIYGTQTVNAVKRFQKANGLTADGIAGSTTQSRIKSIVTNLQTNLNSLGFSAGTVDGVYGTSTKNAVKKFQSAYGLTADGVAGSVTLSKISSAKSTNVSTYSRTNSNVVTYSLARDGNKKLTNNFSVSEFKCNDGSDTILIDHKLVALLQEIRNYFGKPVIINSAYRTAAYNRKTGGSSSSLHLSGKAADIRIAGVSPAAIAKYCESLGVKGIGVYSTFLHVDTRTTKYYWRTSGSATWQVSTFK